MEPSEEYDDQTVIIHVYTPKLIRAEFKITFHFVHYTSRLE